MKRPLPPSEAEKTSSVNQSDEHYLCTKVFLLHLCLIFAQRPFCQGKVPFLLRGLNVISFYCSRQYCVKIGMARTPTSSRILLHGRSGYLGEEQLGCDLKWGSTRALALGSPFGVRSWENSWPSEGACFNPRARRGAHRAKDAGATCNRWTIVKCALAKRAECAITKSEGAMPPNCAPPPHHRRARFPPPWRPVCIVGELPEE